MTDAKTFDPSRYLTKVGSADYLEVKIRVSDLRVLFEIADQVNGYQHSVDNHGAPPFDPQIPIQAVDAVTPQLLKRVKVLLP